MKTTNVWTVSEQSDQKTLEKFEFSTNEGISFSLAIHNLLLGFIELSDQQPTTSEALPAPARQLRVAGKWTNGDLWLRTKAALYLKIEKDFIQVITFSFFDNF